MKKIFTLLIALLIFYATNAQSISGYVLNEENEPLSGANIVLKGTYIGTSTNKDGYFSFKNLKEGNYKLNITFIGYQKKEVAVNTSDEEITVHLKPSVIMNEDVIIIGTRADEDDPIAYTTISQSEIEENNTSQDIPYVLSMTPSVVTTSDAGTGIGYTNFRIRGTDLNRINITVNGIPLNDAESHGVWWVNMPDFISSVDNIQIQRGVGTSSNGAAAFGATVNLQTIHSNHKPNSEILSYMGSYNTFRNTISFGTGLLNDHFIFDGRVSKINSDGFIDRAFSDLESIFLSGSYHSEKSIVKINISRGSEKTYQAWYGVPKVKLENDIDGMTQLRDHYLIDDEELDNLLASDARTYNYYTYENETDNYTQSHYHIHFSHGFNSSLNFNAALHYTKGEGYYEQYKKDEDFADYNLNNLELPNDTITSTDLIRQKWLDNDFYGIVALLNYHTEKTSLTIGGGWNNYDGDHFGEIIWAQYAAHFDKDYQWYDNTGLKTDYNIYSRINYQLTSRLNGYIDLQYRHINYSIDGIDDDLRDITQTHNFNFFNPKVGVHYEINDKNSSYFYFGIANREPNRSNYTDARPNEYPTHETLYDYELGYEFTLSNILFNLNLYYMDYRNQLVLTGEINDVGSPIMTNVENSYRMGVEVSGAVKITEKIEFNFNATLSENKIENYTDYLDNWDQGGQEATNLGTTDLSFSPSFINAGELTYTLKEKLNITWQAKYVGRQFIDNTSSLERSIDPYFVNDLKMTYTFNVGNVASIDIRFMVNNIFNHEYESNAWVYRYIYQNEEHKYDGYFPQAGRHYMGGIRIRFN